MNPDTPELQMAVQLMAMAHTKAMQDTVFKVLAPLAGVSEEALHLQYNEAVSAHRERLLILLEDMSPGRAARMQDYFDQFESGLG